MIYNWNTARVTYTFNSYAMNETFRPDGSYSVDITDSVDSVIDKLFNSIPDTGTYTHEYHIPEIKKSNSDTVVVYRMETETTSDMLFEILLTDTYVESTILGETNSVPYTPANNTSYRIDIKLNTVDGVYDVEIHNITTNSNVIDDNGTGTPIGDLSDTLLTERHIYDLGQGTFDVVRPVTTKGILAVEPITIYADITDGVPNGNGTESSPYNFGGLSADIENNLGNPSNTETEYLYMIKGHKELDPTEATMFPTPINYNGYSYVEFRGWDIETYGPPIFGWTYDWDDSNYFLCRELAWWGDTNSATNPNVSAVFRDICITSKYGFNCRVNDSKTKYIDTVFVTPMLLASAEYAIQGNNLELLGCTISCDDLYILTTNELYIRDCVLTCDNIIGREGTYNGIYMSAPNKLIMLDNITTSQNISLQSSTDLTEYIAPIYDDEIIRYPKFDDFNTFIDFYTNRTITYYSNYNIPTYSNVVIDRYRQNANYNNGLFNNPRLTYGAYSFLPDDPFVDEFPTSGHIGSFYFGGDYDNGNATSLYNSITLSPTADISISTKVNVIESNLNISIPDRNGPFATGVVNFSIDFVGKQKYEDVYPKFCEAISVDDECETCNNPMTSATDWSVYNKQIAGGNPLVVDFSACANSLGEYIEYKPVTYKWWFDYENYPNEYATCAVSSATHTYCGGYLEEYDVRLCVEFQ